MNYWKPRKKFGAICADPPWRFYNFSSKGEGRNAVAHYDCMTIDELCEWPVADLAAKDCALFLWTTDPMLPQALRVIEAWGFKFKTVAFYWVKAKKNTDLNCMSENDFFTGLGYWTRANVEQCLLATRGSPKRKARDVKRLLIAKRREHSRKPDEAYKRIEQLVGGPYLDLFSRETRRRWDSVGAETGLFDKGLVSTRRFPSDLARIQAAE